MRVTVVCLRTDRGPEMPMHGRQLTVFALYWSLTGDPEGLLLSHFDRIQGLVAVLRRIRAKSLSLPKEHPAYGMPAGNDEADLGGSSIECGTTFGENLGDCQTELWVLLWNLLAIVVSASPDCVLLRVTCLPILLCAVLTSASLLRWREGSQSWVRPGSRLAMLLGSSGSSRRVRRC